MVPENTDSRVAGLEWAYEYLNKRVGTIEQRLLDAEIVAFREEIRDFRRQMTIQFYWLLTAIIASILIPILRDTIR